VVDRSNRNFEIEGGAQRGRNLFHSFQQFNVDEGGSVYFLNPNGVSNIFSRVTGANRSDILGTLGVRGSANLFLMNPNGILFGQNARLDVQGSFVGTTANAIGFGEQGFFSATNPEAPSQLLTVNPSAFLFNQIPAPIQNQSRASAGQYPANSFDTFGLRVPDGRSLLLLGGDINIDGGGLVALGGRIELGGAAGPGTIGLNLDTDSFRFVFPESISRADVTLTNGAGVLVAAGGGGDAAIYANNVNVLSGSSLQAGIGPSLGTGDSQAGDIILDATEKVVIDGNASILNNVNSGGTGNAGNIFIETERLDVSNTALVGNETAGTGNSGDVIIETRHLNVNGGAQIYTSTAGSGNAGDLTIRASDSVELTGESSAAPGGLFAQNNITTEGMTGAGSSGRLLVETNRLRISNGSKVQVSTFGIGDAGTVVVRADDVEIFNNPGNRRFSTGIFAEVANPATTGISRGAGLRSEGNGGNLIIEAERLSIRGGGQVSTSTHSDGNAGRLRVQASDWIEVVGSNSGSNAPSFLGANVFQLARGQGGNINLETNRLSVRAGGQVSVRTFGEGDAGTLRVHANQIIEVDGGTPDGQPSEVNAAVEAGSTGRGGNLILNTDRLRLTNRAQISTSTSGRGSSGSITVRASDVVFLDNASILTELQDQAAIPSTNTNPQGNITIQTRSLSLNNRARISADTFGAGNAGNIFVGAEAITLSGRSNISTAVNQGAIGQGGNINLQTGTLRIDNRARIRSSTAGEGNTGRIRIQAREGIALFNRSRIASNVDEGAIGNSQEIILQTPQLFLSGNSRISADTLAEGNAGDIFIRGAEAISLFNSSISTSVGTGVADQRGGNISIQTDSLTLNNNARITAQSQGESGAGNVRVSAAGQLTANNSDITTSAQNASGGAIDIQAAAIRLRGDSDIRTEVASDTGNGGDITLAAGSIVAFDDSDILAFAGRQGGDIRFATPAAFFDGGYEPATETTSSASILEHNNRADINAAGAIPGNVILPDTSFIQNSLSALPETAIDTDRLIANSCIARTESGGTFLVTGAGGLPPRPGVASPSSYPTGEVRMGTAEGESDLWQPGEAIVEPQGVYQLDDGQLVMSRACF
jgi:filamentous hemagglutinin family protein